MGEPAYTPAYRVARQVQDYFSRRRVPPDGIDASTRERMIDAEAIEEIIETAFWASLRREEGHSPVISLVLLPPSPGARPLLFKRPLPLSPGTLVRLAPAVERPGIHLGVWWHGTDLHVWGTTRIVPSFCVVIEVIAPGLLVVKHPRNDETAKYINVAVLQGDVARMLDQDALALWTAPELVSTLLAPVTSDTAGQGHVLFQLAVSMRAHKRGGSLLVVPSDSDTWVESVVHPILYAVQPPFSDLADLMREAATANGDRRWQDALRRAIDVTAGLTAVDGATIVTDDYRVLAFGAKLGRRDGRPQVDRISMTEPIEGSSPWVGHPSQLGGTRHLSAAQFAQDQPGAVALVASVDDRFTVFSWSEPEQMVHAYRIEALLL